MGDIIPQDDLVSQLQNQLSTARSEIKNLRQQIANLKHTHKKSVDEIQNALKEAQCERCKTERQDDSCSCEFSEFQSIGKIESWFVEKRGVPRQAGVCTNSKGVLVLSPSVINNPSYALNGLEEFSHLWIIYHFHRTDSNHVRTKVAPPRLNGARVGVFGTRSPHRPNPIGLTLVKIDSITENKIYFSGVDMLDGTPVLDIKPYIPQYDSPSLIEQRTEREVEGGLSDDEPAPSPSPFSLSPTCAAAPTPGLAATAMPVIIATPAVVAPIKDENQVEGREAPDGEEASVRVPSWITNPATSKLKVEFSEKGLSQLKDITKSDQLKSTIISVLEEDPRSVYLRQKLGNQFYTFLIQDVHVSCKFDDANHVVTIYQIHPGKQMCECGIPQWQCTVHSQ